jgi:hypothetical protein
VAINRMLKRSDHLFLITDIGGQARGDPAALAADRIGEPVQLVLRACQHHHGMPGTGETDRQGEAQSFANAANDNGAS